MRREDLERYLERGDCLGFRKQTGSEDTLGWILLDRREPHERLPSLLAPGERPEFVAAQEQFRRAPHHVFVVELPREAHERGDYLSNEHYRLRENHDFASPDGVETFVNGYGLRLEEIKWLVEIDAP